MKLSKLVSMAALSGTMLGVTPSATAQSQQEGITPPSIQTDVVETLPRARMPDASTSYVEATNRLYQHRDSLDAHTPEYAETLWDASFTTINDDALFVTVSDSSSVIGTLRKDTTWSADYLRANIDSSFHDELPSKIQSRYPQNAKRLDTRLDNEAETTWNSGRRTTLRANLHDNGHFLESYEAMFADVNLPVSLVAQLGVESSFNPQASSYAACGVGQIRDWHVNNIEEEQPFPDCENPVMADVTAKIIKGQMMVYDIPYFQSSMMYHSGIGNWKKVCAIGREVADSSGPTRCYDGLQAMLNNRDSPALDDLLGSAGIDTRHYPAQVNAMIDVYRSIPDTASDKPMETVRTSEAVSVTSVAEHTGVRPSTVRSYNPQVDSRFSSGSYVNLPSNASTAELPGDDVSTWDEPSFFFHRLRSYDFPSDPDSLVDDLNRFIRIAEDKELYKWSGALRVIRTNQESLNAYQPALTRRINDITSYLNRAQDSDAGTARR